MAVSALRLWRCGSLSGGFDNLKAIDHYLCDNLVYYVSPVSPEFKEVRVCFEGNLCKDEFSMQNSRESAGLAAFVYRLCCGIGEELYHHLVSWGAIVGA